MNCLWLARGLPLLAAVLASTLSAAAPGPAALVETPSLAADVEAGRLPPIAARVPGKPRVIDLKAMDREVGRHGGSIRMLLADPRDLRMLTIYSYARLVGYDSKLTLVPDILAAVDVTEERIYTFRLRPGHRWSDGAPFTAEDFRYFWEDVANNKTLSPSGPPVEMLVNSEPPKFEVLDPLTVRFTWNAPNANFLPSLAGGRPLYLYMPFHYLKQFHEKYLSHDELEELVKSERVRSWGALHDRKARQYRPENPDLPTLDPWIPTTRPPSTHFVFRRNPYFHRIDTAGQQLPYADEVILDLGSNSLVPAKTGSGEADLQARYIRFDNYTFLKDAERRGRIKVNLWERGEGSKIAIQPNLNANDPVWRAVFRDVRVRRALSLAINRHEINASIFYGLARESGNTVLPESPLYRKEYARAWATFDLVTANRLLDEAGLHRDTDGVRLLPDGRRAELVVETSGESTEEADVLSLVRDTWRQIGIVMYPRPTQRELFRKRIYAGDTLMSVWTGMSNGVPTSEMSPEDLAPSSQAQLQWPKWGLYTELKGTAGEAADMPEAQELTRLLVDWQRAKGAAERTEIWHRMLQINADQVFTIGTVNGTKQPIAVAPNLRNVPDEAIFNFSPGAYFGIYMMDTFWFDRMADQ